MLRIEKLTYRIAGRVLFENADATIAAGHRVGLVGANGTGKSTLFRLILGEIEPDGGRIVLRPGARVASVAQEAPGGEETLLDFVLAADRERAALLAEAETAESPERIAAVHTRLADIGAHAAPARAARILAGLGFDAQAQARPLSAFSGGWRMRVALAATLFVEPDLLLLDEPTNYLDLEGTLWLESHLRRYPHTLIVASHDRALLNGAVERILHVERRGLAAYRGGFDDFLRARAERRAHAEAARAKQEAARRHMQAFVDRFRYKATKARQAQSRLKALARLAPIEEVESDATARFRFPEPKPLASPIVTLDGVAVGYAPGKPVLRGLDLRIDADDRIALLGANGNGKSTFVKLIAGALAPESGRMARARGLRIGYFAQHQIEALDPARTAQQHMAELMPGEPESRVRAYLGGFGLTQEKAEVAAAGLSGGERARLVLAMMAHGAPQLLLLDEPTNHLDIGARDALIAALNEFEGAIVLITHDRHLVEACADRLWLVSDGGVRPYSGDMDDYRRMLLAERGNGADEAASKTPRPSRREKRRAAAAARADRAGLRRRLREAEAALARLAAEKRAIEERLAAPETYAGDKEALARLMKKNAETARAIEAAETVWLEVQEALEAVDSD